MLRKTPKQTKQEYLQSLKLFVIAWAVFVLGSLTIHAGALIKVLNT